MQSSDPGGARQGNFINYYQFNPAAKRIAQIPKDLLTKFLPKFGSAPVLCLDIGCNSGELTEALFHHFGLGKEGDHILGVDIDQDLVKVAREKCDHAGISFEQCNVTEDVSVLKEFLSKHKRDKFDVIFCFSVSMWIHLNQGEQGLAELFGTCSSLCESLFILEPQPWKCYMTAARRMRKLNLPEFEHLKRIESKQSDLIPHLVKVCESHNKLKLIDILGETEWKRQIMLFKAGL